MKEELAIAKRSLQILYKPYKGEYLYQGEIDLAFVEENELEELFWSMFEQYDVQKHSSNGEDVLGVAIDEINKLNQPNESIEKNELLEKKILLLLNGKYVLNPFLRNHDELPIRYLNAINELSKITYYYPFVDDTSFVSNVISSHNIKYSLSLTHEMILGGEDKLSGALFRNVNSIKIAFVESLCRFIHSVPTNEWKSNISRYASLLIEIHRLEIDLRLTVSGLSLSKKRVLLGFLANSVNIEDARYLADPNFYNRLQYVPYELCGVNIHNPAQTGVGNNLIPFSSSRYSEKNPFKSLSDSALSSFREASMLSHCCFIELDFIAEVFRDQVKLIPDRLFVLPAFNEMLIPSYGAVWDADVIELHHLGIVPYILFILIDPHQNYSRHMDDRLDHEELRVNVLKFYLNSFELKNREFCSIVFDFYVFLSNTLSRAGRERQRTLLKNVRNAIGDYLLPWAFEPEYVDILDAIFSIRPLYHFNHFELFADKDIKRYSSQLLEAYWDVLSDENFVREYTKVIGINLIELAISKTSSDEVLELCILKPIDDKSQTIYYDKHRTVFHLTVICKSIVMNSNVDAGYLDYVLPLFKELRNTGKICWDDIVSRATYSEDEYGFDESSTLTFCLFDVVDKYYPDPQAYFDECQHSLSFSEKVVIKNFAKIDIGNNALNCVPNTTNLGMARREAKNLIGRQYYREGLMFIDYVYEIEKANNTTLMNDNLRWLQVFALMECDDFNAAHSVIGGIKDQHTKALAFGFFEYKRENFLKALQIFTSTFLYRPMPDDILIQYTACLIKLQRYSEVVSLIQPRVNDLEDNAGLLINLCSAYYYLGDASNCLKISLQLRNSNARSGEATSLIVQSISAFLPSIVNEILSLGPMHPQGRSAISAMIESSNTAVMDVLKAERISDGEISFIRELILCVKGLQEMPVFLEKISETECSDLIKKNLDSFARSKNLIVERERPQGYAQVNSGEIDFYVSTTQPPIVTVAVGENKEWGKFNSQLSQLIGYMEVGAGFGFTIIFNKSTKLQTILKSRENTLKQFCIEQDGKSHFAIRDGRIYRLQQLIPDAPNEAVLTIHESPERTGASFRIYHLILNAYSPERKQSAKEARR